MKIDLFLKKIRQGGPVTFQETLQTVEENFVYTPVRFTNGLGDSPVVNPAGKNEGSCKIFSLGKRFGLSKEETLSLFGELYRKDVLENPDGTDHANIRRFMKDGWGGVRFDAEPLTPRK